MYADRRTWGAILAKPLRKDNPEAKEIIAEFSSSEEFSSVLFEMDSILPSDLTTKGRIYDLDASFQRVNRSYFAGQIDKPCLHWNNVPTTCKFGHYQKSHDTIMISVSLDDPKVPEMLLDFIMYHELLHKKHGVTRKNGRRIVHSIEFREEERLFVEYEKAEALLKSLAKKMRKA